jgi:hypothetical protein
MPRRFRVPPARRNVPDHGIRLPRSPPRVKPKSIVKENDLDVNRSHLNTAVTREIVQNLIQSRLPGSHHWEPPGSSFFATCDNLDKVPFSVGIDAEDGNLQIRSVCVIHPPQRI